MQMKLFFRHGLAIAGLIAALSAFAAPAAHAAQLPRSLHEFGQVAATDSFERVIRLTAATVSVSVYRGETVKFFDKETGKSFLWRFDTPPHAENFPLGNIAPAGFPGGQAVTTYVWDVPPPGAGSISYLLGARSSDD
jgi:hypothetical protein